VSARPLIGPRLLAALALCGTAAVAVADSTAPQGGAPGPGSSTCFGQFANPITDICWSCIFPVSIGGIDLLTDGQDDIPNPSSPICLCPGAPLPRIGVEIGYWEPARQVEVTRTPGCFPSLGGLYIDFGFNAPPGDQHGRGALEDRTVDSFYQVHYYVNPVLYWLQVLADDVCLEAGSFDLAYMTELDPSWNDDQLSMILNPEVVLFANPIAIGACAADCVASSLGFGTKEMFWCSGCNGLVYPFDGHVQAHVGGVQASSLLVHRMLAKMHREMLAWSYHGDGAVCGPQPEPLMDKTAYKVQLLYPIPATGKDASGRCCQPLGRTTVEWGMGKEFPIKGEDFSYMVFRKRNCCAY
jgi:conjugal transfer pilus assembly protein TraU